MRGLTHEEYEQRLFNIESDLYPIEPYINNRTKIKHECINGHIVSIKPNAVLDSKNGCSICAGRYKRNTEEYKELLKNKPLICLEDYKGNGIPIKHQCLKCDHVWKIRPSNITNMNQGCPECSTTGFKINKSGIFYYIKISSETETYYKVGITNNSIKQRFVAEKDKHIEILAEVYFDKGQDAYNLEQQILKEFDGERVNGNKFLKQGNTELFLRDILQMES